MKKHKKLIAAVLIAMACLGVFRVGMVVGAASLEPGSEGDPLITQSYLESRLAEIGAGTSSDTKEKNIYEKVTLSKNAVLTAETGGEIILFSGNASIIGKNGLINLSTGEVFQTGNSAVKYNIYLSTASSSGVKAASDVTVFIKGSYTIK